MNGAAAKVRQGRLTLLLAILLAAIAVLALNLFGRLMLDKYRLDVTQERLFTITAATKRVLDGLKEPVLLRFYYSRALGEQAAPYAEHGAHIAAMLRRYAALAPGRLQVEIIDPEPYSEQEDTALAAGLQAVPLPDGRNAWFGIVGENTTGQREILPFLPVERAQLLEYDLTLLVHRLSLPRKPVVGVLTSLPMFGKMLPSGRRGTEWAIIAQLRAFYQVRRIDPAGRPDQMKDLDALLLATPVVAKEPMWRAVERFILSGKPVIMAVDPYTEAAMTEMSLLGQGTLKDSDTLVKILRHWGIEPALRRFVADPGFAREVIFTDDTGRRHKAPWLAWLELNGNAFAKSHEGWFINVGSINMGSAGALHLSKGAGVNAEPLIAASEEARLMNVKLLFPPDPVKLLATYRAGGAPGAEKKRPWVALRVKGRAQPYFKNEKGKKNEADRKASPHKRSSEKLARSLNLLLIGDSDFLADRFWARLQDIGAGRKLVLPLAGNATFLINALSHMTGGEALTGLRGRTLKQRRFKKVEELRRAAEAQYRAREQALQRQLKAAEKKLSGITARVQGGKLVINERDRRRIADVRAEILQLRRRLRDVQQALVRDIRQMEFRLQVFNIAGPAIIVLLAGLLVWGLGRWRLRGVVQAGRAGA